MKCFLISLLAFCGIGFSTAQSTNDNHYLESVKDELRKEWPGNRSVNLVFHGHSVPSGYFATPTVNTQNAYPLQSLLAIKRIYKNAVVNAIVTAIGGENSIKGATRFANDVLVHKPDVVFIDYALNDRWVGLKEAKLAWKTMIRQALEYGCKIVLLTPTPDTAENILDHNAMLHQYAEMIKKLSVKYAVGIVDSYGAFKKLAQQGNQITNYMSQSNHPNEAGHGVVVEQIVKLFE